MCGILGLLNFNQKKIELNVLSEMSQAIGHRGSDSERIISSQNTNLACPFVALGHRRLAVLDLSEASAQPMRAKNHDVWIVYNGELFNYKELRLELEKKGYVFHTKSDTEVLLNSYIEYGKNCTKYFNGMYAFAIWDGINDILFCSRDPVGIKPFYFHISEDGFYFCSESNAIAKALELPLSCESIYAYLLSMYVPGSNSIYSGIKKLLPGTSLTVNLKSQLKIDNYWNNNCFLADLDDYDLSDYEIENLICNSIEQQLQSDVPVGAFLSGGVDSGLIVAIASKFYKDLRTYSAGYTTNSQINELPASRAISKIYGTKHQERVITNDEVIPLIDKCISSMSEPISDSSMVPTYALSELAASDGVKVILSGTGGDELFAGYTRYSSQSFYRKILNNIPIKARKFIPSILVKNFNQFRRITSSNFDMLMSASGSSSILNSFGLTHYEKQNYYDHLISEILDNRTDSSHYFDNVLRSNMNFDFNYYLPDELLLLLDQMTMAHTIEGRVPLLDIKIIEASLSVKSSRHFDGKTTKKLLRKIAANYLPNTIVYGKKMGFSGPVLDWVVNNEKYFKECIYQRIELPGFEKFEVDKLWNQKRNFHWASQVFAIYILNKWHRSHI